MEVSKRSLLVIIILVSVSASLPLFPAYKASLFAEEDNAGLNLYFVRHAETLANFTGDYSEHNQRTITEKGMRQIEYLTEFLKRYEFDAIIVSPKLRTIKTIEPYLKETNAVAEIWPEMAESGYIFTKKKDPDDERFMRGDEIILDGESSPYFRFRFPEDKFAYKDRGFDSVLARLKKGCRRIDEYFGQSGKTILVVGHSGSGAIMIDILLGNEPVGSYFSANAHVTHLEQKADGKFRLVSFNISPEDTLSREKVGARGSID